MAPHAHESLADYVTYLRGNPPEVRAPAEDLVIRVTSFFRDPLALEVLAAKAYPGILRKKSIEDPIRIRVPGCATGEEADSLAICLAEFLERCCAKMQLSRMDLAISYPLLLFTKKCFSRAGSGCGIGLAIAKRIVELPMGRIWAESEQGKGAPFRFTIPAAR